MALRQSVQIKRFAISEEERVRASVFHFRVESAHQTGVRPERRRFGPHDRRGVLVFVENYLQLVHPVEEKDTEIRRCDYTCKSG